MYLILFTILFIIAVFLIIKCLFDITEKISNRKKVYLVKNNNDKYFVLSLFFSFSKYFENVLKHIKFNFFVEYVNKIDVLLKGLSYPMNKFNAYNFILLQCSSMILSILFTIILIGFDVVIFIPVGILFFVLPYIKIYEEHNKIVRQITKGLPNICDLLSVLLVSGVDFHNSIIKISNIIDGLLAKELKEVMLQVDFGIDIKDAFEQLSNKYNIEQLNLFVRTINSALVSGVGLSDALNTISHQLKLDDASIAEKKAQEAPIKMLLPMVFFILPTIFILLFTPIIISFFTN